MRSIGDLPAHPLFVHAPVALMPLMAVFAVALLVRPAWRARFGMLFLIGAAVLLVGTLLAVSSGQEFDEVLQANPAGGVDTDEHERLAAITRVLVVVFFVVVAALVFYERWPRPTSSQISLALSAATVMVAALATWYMVRTGDEGATLVWRGVLPDDG